MAANPPLNITDPPATFQANYATLAEEHVNRDPAYTASDAKTRVVAQWGNWMDGALFAFQELLYDYPGSANIIFADGSVSMTGDFDLDGNDIVNGVNLNGRAIAEFPIAPLTVTAATFAYYSGTTGQTLTNTNYTVNDVVLRAGTVPFTAVQSGVDPTADAHLTTRAWIAARGGWVSTGVAATHSVAGRQANYTSTSNTSMTDFTNGVAGQEITYHIDSATKQFIYGANTLRTKNGITAQLRQGDAITFSYDGTRWWEIHRSEAGFITGLGGLTTPNILGVQAATISGSTTIADFLNPYTGQILPIIATSSFQIQHGSGLIELNGSVDYDMTAGDTLLLWYDGTAWQEMSRKVA